MGSLEGEYLVDLTTATTSDEEGLGDSASAYRTGRTTLCSESDTDSSDDPSSNLSSVVELVIDKCSGGEEPLEKKKQKLNKSSKPPRPPKGPVLSASDLKLVKELSELAARKRARIERMKALRKMKDTTKRSTSTTNLTAMLMTALFFIVILFQGAFSGNNARKELVESPAPATTNEGLVSYQVLYNAPTNEVNQPSSLSLNSVEKEAFKFRPSGGRKRR
ncbi:hypothetical protein RND81_10G250800 [Saponaria officinalis]|uniref:Transmembrane protein n=1 Tax=Saponaria officinalis TaxID=3572 RepID=A0AAW1I812_SAPOF